MHTNATAELKPNFMSSLLLCAVFLKKCPLITLKIKNLDNKDSPKDSLFIFLVLNAVIFTLYHVKAV